MPYATVAELRASPLFQGMPMLQTMASGKLQRFLDIFNRVLARALRGGASPADAEKRAIPIALIGARKATVMPAGRVVEDKVATYAIFAQDMAHGEGADTDLKYANIDDINDVVAGQTFFGHTHDRELAEPLGVIHRFIAAENLPADVRAKVDPGISIVSQVSFFADVPIEDRLDTISPEWTSVKYATGEEVEIPTNFVTTKTPANHPTLGIKRVAEQASDENARPYLQRIDLEVLRAQMPEMTVESLKAELAKKEAELRAAPKAAALEELQDKYASLETKHTELLQKMAALAGVDANGAEKPKEDEILKGLNGKYASLETKVHGLELAAKTAEANAWAADLVKSKEVAMDSKPHFVALFLSDPKAAESIKAGLSDRILLPGRKDGVNDLTKLDPKKAEAELKFIAEAFP